MMRKIVSEMAPKIMFDDLPYVDRILRLCLDVYLVRESGDLCLEEDLFAKLIFLYRSPETLIRLDHYSYYLQIRNIVKILLHIRNHYIRWTRPPEEGEQTDNDEQDEEEEERQGEERRGEEQSRRD